MRVTEKRNQEECANQRENNWDGNEKEKKMNGLFRAVNYSGPICGILSID